MSVTVLTCTRQTAEHTNETYIKYGKDWKVTFTPGVVSLLRSNGIPLESISTIIYGHAHFDHFGNLGPFPPDTTLVVGPGTETGKDLAHTIDVPLSTVENRTVRYLSRDQDDWKRVGSLEGLDYFGDGSLFILDTPGVWIEAILEPQSLKIIALV